MIFLAIWRTIWQSGTDDFSAPGSQLPFVMCSTALGGCANSPSGVAHSLKGKVVFLRGTELGDKLSFDTQGNLVGKATVGPFAYGAVKIEKLHQSSVDLEIKGKRVALVFYTNSAITSERIRGGRGRSR
jgi:hypothetical protein